MKLKILKLENCDVDVDLQNRKIKLRDFADEVTMDTISNYNESNKFLCDISKRIREDLPSPKMFFLSSSTQNTIYSLEFISGKEDVFLGALIFEYQGKNQDEYVNSLIQDSYRIWNVIKLAYDTPQESEKLTNQVLSLLRICKIDKDDYIKDKGMLSHKFRH